MVQDNYATSFKIWIRTAKFHQFNHDGTSLKKLSCHCEGSLTIVFRSPYHDETLHQRFLLFQTTTRVENLALFWIKQY